MTDPTSPSVESTPATPSAAPAVNGTVLAPNLAAALAALFSLVGGIFFLVVEKQNKFVRFHAMQATFLGAAGVIVWFVFGVITAIPLVGVLLAFVLWLPAVLFSLGWVVIWGICVYKAFMGEEWEIPKLGQLARKQLAQMDAPQNPPVM